MENLIRQVSLDRSSRKKDKSVSITFITDTEQTAEQFMEIDKLGESRGVLYYKPMGELTQQEVDELDNVDVELEGKTKSQRLRSVMYVYWKQLGGQGEFKEFYSSYMERIIENIKTKLD